PRSMYALCALALPVGGGLTCQEILDGVATLPEERVELLGPADVVVVLEHAHEERLAHPSRPQEQEAAWAELLQDRQERRLVDVEVALRPELGEVGDAVRDLHAQVASRPTLPPPRPAHTLPRPLRPHRIEHLPERVRKLPRKRPRHRRLL